MSKMPAMSPPSQTGKLNTGNGRNHPASRALVAMALYIGRKSEVASSKTCSASANAIASHE